MRKITYITFIILAVLTMVLYVHTEAYAFDTDLYRGLRKHSGVTELQEFLTNRGLYTGPITGNFFDLTLEAVKKFQIVENITPAFGYFGPLSRARANAILAAGGIGAGTVTDESGLPVAAVPVLTDEEKIVAELVELRKQVELLIKEKQLLEQQLSVLMQISANTTPPPPNPAPAPTPTPEPTPVVVPPAPAAPVIVSFTGTPRDDPHDAYILKWQSENSTECSLDLPADRIESARVARVHPNTVTGVTVYSNSVVVYPLHATTYTLTCIGLGGATSKELSLEKRPS